VSVALVRYPAALVLPAAAGGLVALALTAPTPHMAAALGGLTIVGALTIWPWAALPVAVIGGSVASTALGVEGVTSVVAVHTGLLALGFLALGLRRAVDSSWRRMSTPADVPMLVLAAGVALGGAYGLAVGNAVHEAMVAAYQIAVIPIYFLLATLTLSSRQRLQAAGVLFVAGAATLALAEIATPGRHGGLLSVLALFPTVAAASTARGGRRWVLLALAAALGLDVLLSAYRAIWLAAAVALIVLLARRASGMRSTLLVSLACVLTVAFVAIGLSSAVGARAELVGTALEESSGYRLPEAGIGLQAFLAQPIAGEGFGQVTEDVYVDTFGVVDVGPVYHVFYVTLLANGGLMAVALLMWPLLRAFRHAWRSRSAQVHASLALLAGFVAAAAFAAPTDGHWELGLLPAVALIAVQLEAGRAGS
jgi:hypothetical protein